MALFGRWGDPAGKIEELAVKAESCTLVVIFETIAPGAAVRRAAGLAYGDGRRDFVKHRSHRHWRIVLISGTAVCSGNINSVPDDDVDRLYGSKLMRIIR